MTHEVRRPEFTSLVDADAPVRRIGTGFTFTEGPLWHPTEHYLLFSDMPGDVRRRWDEAGGVREVARPSNKCNGMTYDAELNLVICEHATSSLVRLAAGGGREVLASHFEGKELNSPNDVCIRSDGVHLLQRPLVRADAALRGGAPARAWMAGGVSRVHRRRASPRRRQAPVRPAERAVLLARREQAVRERHDACADSGVRRRRPTARSRTGGCSRRGSSPRARRAFRTG